MSADDPQVEVESRAQLRQWLHDNHERPGSIWLVTFKKIDPERYIPYDHIVEEALCFGWIDSLPRALDETRSMRRLSPRKPGSVWSAVNKARIERLDQAGLMHPAGKAVIERAKADGSWTRQDAAQAGHIPGDLEKALAERPPASEVFDGFPPSVRRGLLGWVEQARRPETRARRIQHIAEHAQRGERLNPDGKASKA